MQDKMKENLKEILALFTVLLILIALPFFIWRYENVKIPADYGKGAKVINLSAKVKDEECLWTLERISGFNYWWKKFKFADEIPVNVGDKVVFRVKSSDVLHSFAIPQFRVGPYEIEAGKVTEVKWTAEREGNFKYLCWLWCSDCHGDLSGQIIVGDTHE